MAIVPLGASKIRTQHLQDLRRNFLANSHNPHGSPFKLFCCQNVRYKTFHRKEDQCKQSVSQYTLAIPTATTPYHGKKPGRLYLQTIAHQNELLTNLLLGQWRSLQEQQNTLSEVFNKPYASFRTHRSNLKQTFKLPTHDHEKSIRPNISAISNLPERACKPNGLLRQFLNATPQTPSKRACITKIQHQ